MNNTKVKIIFDYIRSKLGMNDPNSNANNDNDNDDELPQLMRDITKEFRVVGQNNDLDSSYLFLSPLQYSDIKIVIGWSYFFDSPIEMVKFFKDLNIDEHPELETDPRYCGRGLIQAYANTLTNILTDRELASFYIDRTYEEH